MPHENATATRLLATHCAVCGRPLVDAQSVETGIGPICRERYFGVEALTEPARVEANGLVYRVAAELSRNPSDANLATVSTDLLRLRELGATTIVERILANRSRLSTIKIVIAPADPTNFGVVAPRNEALTAAFRNISSRRWYGSGRTWMSATRLNVFARSQWPAVRDALRAAFGDAFITLPNGDVSILVADATPGFDVPLPVVDITAVATAADLSGLPNVEIRIAGLYPDRIEVHTPYNTDIVAAFRNIYGRRWNGSANTFRRSSLPEVVAACRRVWPNATIIAPGFTVEPASSSTPVDADAEPPMATRRTGAPAARDGWQTRARAHATDELPAVEYNDGHASWLAESLAGTLEAGGFRTVHLPNTTEIVYGIALADGREILIYTSISSRSGVMRGRGADAIRVATVRDGEGVASTTRVNRAGTINSIVTRVLDRVEELSA